MFEFQANRDDPAKLLDVLERFTRWWFFAPHGEETGVPEERLSLVTLPEPLRRLYGFAGEWPGGTFESIFSHQDHLAPFECLQVQDGKLVFAWENQGTWCVATDPSGEDPPVYLSDDGGPFVPLCDSLSQFLVTFCLHECVFGSPSLSAVDDLDTINKRHGKVPIPIWLDGPYVTVSDEPRAISFFLVDGCILQMDAYWCGGRTHEAAERYPDFFPNNDAHRPKTQKSGRELWEFPEVPHFMKAQHLEMLVRRHEQISESHTAKAEFYRQMLAKLKAESE